MEGRREGGGDCLGINPRGWTGLSEQRRGDNALRLDGGQEENVVRVRPKTTLQQSDLLDTRDLESVSHWE